MTKLLSNLFWAVAEVFGLANRRTDLKNAADVKGAKVAQNNVDRRNEIESSTAKKDVSQTRNDLAE